MARPHKIAPAGAIDEHALILRAARDLDRAFAGATSGQMSAVRQRLLQQTRSVGDSLRKHCASMEQPGGTLAEVEVVIGRVYQLTEARSEHELLLDLADGLLAAIEQVADPSAPLAADVPARCMWLTNTVRAHCVNETDLLQIRFTFDVGVVD